MQIWEVVVNNRFDKEFIMVIIFKFTSWNEILGGQINVVLFSSVKRYN